MSYDCMVEKACVQVTAPWFDFVVQNVHVNQMWAMCSPALASVCCRYGGHRRLYLQPAEPVWISARVSQILPQTVLQV